MRPTYDIIVCSLPLVIGMIVSNRTTHFNSNHLIYIKGYKGVHLEGNIIEQDSFVLNYKHSHI